MSEQSTVDQETSPQVGALLRASRLRVGDDLREVADVLRIRYLYLEAIEDCRYEDLPGETYAIGFIRSYAEHLGLDGEEVVRRFRAEAKGTKRANDLAFPTPVQESGVPKGAVVFVGVILALLIYGGWYITTTDEDFFTDLISPVPDRLAHMVEGEETASTPNQNGTTPNVENPAPVPVEQESAVVDPEPASEPSASEATNEPIENEPVAPEPTTETPVAESAPAETPSDPEPVDVADVSPEAAQETVEDAAAETAPEIVPEQTTDTVTEPVADAATGVEDAAEAVVEATQSETEQQASDTVADASAAVEETVDTVTAAVPEPASTVEDAAESTTGEEVQTETDTPTAVDPAPSETASEESSEPEASSAEGAVTAEDLNAQSLLAATGQAPDTSEVAAITPNTETEPEVEPETSAPADTAPAVISDTGIVIRAAADSWVEITNGDGGSIVFTGVMSAGDVFDVPSQDGLLLATGNAGVLEIFVDGSAVPEIGGIGAVRRGVVLEPARLRDGTATDR